MDALKEIETPEEVEVDVFPINHPEFYRQDKMVDDKGLNKTDVIARAKAMGVREYRDRVILAIQDDDLKPEMGGMFSRADVDTWIDAELAVDRYEDEFMISLQQARALAKEAGLEDYSAAVLNAITRLEIPGVEYRRNQPRIPVKEFMEWLEGAALVEDLQIRSKPELLDLVRSLENEQGAGNGSVIQEAARLIWLPVLSILMLGIVFSSIFAGFWTAN